MINIMRLRYIIIVKRLLEKMLVFLL